MMAAAFPLIADAMFLRLGFEGASSLLGGVAMLLTGVPWVLVLWGGKIRARSRFAKVSPKLTLIFDAAGGRGVAWLTLVWVMLGSNSGVIYGRVLLGDQSLSK